MFFSASSDRLAGKKRLNNLRASLEHHLGWHSFDCLISQPKKEMSWNVLKEGVRREDVNLTSGTIEIVQKWREKWNVPQKQHKQKYQISLQYFPISWTIIACIFVTLQQQTSLLILFAVPFAFCDSWLSSMITNDENAWKLIEDPFFYRRRSTFSDVLWWVIWGFFV